jgi:RNA polymerase sigma factor (sigma-70 family)
VQPLPGEALGALLSRVCAGEDVAWTEFVERFAPLLLSAARTVERDRDAAADAFVFVCEQLRARRFARLRVFDATRPGTFETWLRAVSLNLCRDARRRRAGRFRPFAELLTLPLIEQRVFRLAYEEGFTLDQTFEMLQPEFPGLTARRVADADRTVASCVSDRRRWLLLTRRPQLDALESGDDTGRVHEFASPEPDPEWAVLQSESTGRLRRALATLAPRERLLLRLRYGRGVTLAQLATMFGYRDLQTADRRVRELLTRLRRLLDDPA